MKILILSCDTGEGHNSAGRAVREAAELKGHTVEMMDMFLLSGKRTSHAVAGAYVGIVKHIPFFFGFIYKVGMLISSSRRKSPVYFANALLGKKLASYIAKHDFDIVVTPHLYPAETMTYMKKKKLLHIPAVAVGTDYTCIPFWEETDCDYYVLPHEALKKSCVRRGIPAEKLLAFGIPVAKSCRRNTSREQAREKLGLDTKGRYFLAAGGSMGAGDLSELVKKLLEGTAQEKILVICGSNRKAEQKLKKEFCKQPRVQILGFTTQMSLYLKACDVLFTKPGGLTSTEAAVTGVPMIHTAPIPGCETVNRKFFMKAGMSWSAITLNGQVEKGIQLMNDPEAVAQMVSAQKKQIHGNAVEKLYEFISGEIQKRNRF